MGNNESRNLGISLAMALVAAIILYGYTQEKESEMQKKFGASKSVVVAKEDIAELQTIHNSNLEIKDIPTEFVPPDAVGIPDEIFGRVAAVPIKKGQMIFENSLYALGPDTGISLLVSTSKRAITIPVDEVRAVAKLIRPGDRVDILAAIDAGKGASQRREVKTILPDVSVLATGVSVVNNIPRVFELDSSGKNISQIALTGDTKYNTITVEVDVKQAQDLVYMLSTAPSNIFFTLRNPNDRAPIPRLPSSTADSVLGVPQVSLAPSPSALSPNPSLSPSPAPYVPPRAPAPAPTQVKPKNGRVPL
ncbi:MAG TPA: Flp pilus assembly protein CpaB [Pseudobdellovibrionaceae bacterium]|nr:Flp pilus assembly protein CpaB [Pseudobdellovibrionaceae bacterium]